MNYERKIIQSLKTTGTAFMVQQFDAACDPEQLIREAIINALEAGATEFFAFPDLYFTAKSPNNPYRTMLLDNGRGFSLDVLLKMFSPEGKKQGLHDNFGIGIKMTGFAKNPYGVMVQSFGENSEFVGGDVMLVIKSGNDYGAVPFEFLEHDDDGVLRTVHRPVAPIAQICPEYMTDPWGAPRKHGSTFIFMGHSEDEDTWVTLNHKVHNLMNWTNKRFWELPKVQDPVSPVSSDGRIRAYFWEADKQDDLSGWPRCWADCTGPKHGTVKKGGGRKRQVRGRKAVMDNHPKAIHQGTEDLPCGVRVHWYHLTTKLDNDEPTKYHNGGPAGVVGILYKGEVYEYTRQTARLSAFGVQHPLVQRNTGILVEVTPEKQPDIIPNRERTHLTIRNKASEPFPWALWSREFRAQLPQALQDAYRDAHIEEGDNVVGQVNEELRLLFQGKEPTQTQGQKLTRRRSLGGSGVGHSRGTGEKKHKKLVPQLKWEPGVAEERPVKWEPEDEKYVFFYPESPLLRSLFDYWAKGYANEPASTLEAVRREVKYVVLRTVGEAFVKMAEMKHQGWGDDVATLQRTCYSVFFYDHLLNDAIQRRIHTRLKLPKRQEQYTIG